MRMILSHFEDRGCPFSNHRKIQFFEKSHQGFREIFHHLAQFLSG